VARKYFPDEDPPGKQTGCGINPSDPALTIVGVVSSAPVDSLQEELPPAADTPHLQGYNSISGDMTVVVRASNAEAAMNTIGSELGAVTTAN
jgi:hypothetical protein